MEKGRGVAFVLHIEVGTGCRVEVEEPITKLQIHVAVAYPDPKSLD
jgi:hypothetical protein